MDHTPGPWGLYGSKEPTRGFAEAAPSLSVGSVEHTEPICRVHGYLHDVEANAALIAAAPDLLEACKAALENIERYGSGYCSDNVMEVLTAAIAKAEPDTIQEASGREPG